MQDKGRESVELCKLAREKYKDLDYSFGIAGTSFCLARALLTVDQPEKALAEMDAAIDLLEGLRRDPVNSSLRARFMGARRRFYQFQMELLMELAAKDSRRQTPALGMSEAFRARAFLEELSARASVSSPPSPEFVRRREELERTLRDSAPELQLLSPEIAPDRAAALQSKVKNLVVQLELLRSSTETRKPQEVKAPRLLIPAEIQKEVLGDGTLLLEYMLGEERSFLWLVGKDFVQVVDDLPSERVIRDLAQRYAGLVAERDASMQDAAEKVGEELGQILLHPVADRLGNHRLLISPDGALFRIPFEALPSPKPCPATSGWHRRGPPPLILCNEVVYAASASVLAEVRTEAAHRPRPPKTLAALGDPVFGRDDLRLRTHLAQHADRGAHGALERSLRTLGMGGLERLKESGIEVRKISDGLGKDETLVATGFEATRDLAMNAELAQYRIVHFATHSVVLSDFPELSGLVFSQLDEKGSWKNGFLPLYEIYDLRLPVDLVVLSACSTAKGQEVRGEGVVGLARAFQSAGASRVIVSLWDVDDKATSALMDAFYRNVFNRQLSYSAALRQARIAMLSDTRNPEWAAPYYWAPFILQGEWLRTEDINKNFPSVSQELGR
jgi:CHAT domain-containing protein